MAENPQIVNDGVTKITRNPKRRNDGKSPEILNDEMTEPGCRFQGDLFLRWKLVNCSIHVKML